MREGSYRFYGVTDQTMNHGEGWHFIQLGKYIERACAVSVLLDSHFSAAETARTISTGSGLLTSCAAFEAYCKVYTADLKPERIAEFMLLASGVSVYSSATRWNGCIHALEAISEARLAAKDRQDRPH